MTEIAGQPPVREATASALLLRRDQGQWRVGLVLHPRHREWMAAGGHVEAAEAPSDAVLREIREETGLHADLVPGPALPAPAGWQHPSEPAPWWTARISAAPDGHTAALHTHIDHMFLALAERRTEDGDQGEPDHELGWFAGSRLQTDPAVCKDIRALALDIVDRLGDTEAVDAEQLSAHLIASTALPRSVSDEDAVPGSCER